LCQEVVREGSRGSRMWEAPVDGDGEGETRTLGVEHDGVEGIDASREAKEARSSAFRKLRRQCCWEVSPPRDTEGKQRIRRRGEEGRFRATASGEA
jgi:hypothetical protein